MRTDMRSGAEKSVPKRDQCSKRGSAAGHWRWYLLGHMVAQAALLAAIGNAAAQAVDITPANLAGPLAGGIAGIDAVTPSGGAGYSIALPLPPGSAGMVPPLALSYMSQQEDGLLGRGWSIAGLSSITRCARTLAQDGERAGVQLTAADAFCLDGQKLLLVSGSHGAVAEYRAEIDGFGLVTSAGDNLANGPMQWTVKSRDGRIYTYGGTAASRVEASSKSVVLSWSLSRVEDRRGNYYEFDYDENNAEGEHYPTKVRYTGNLRSGTATFNAVRFVYETRPDPWRGYVVGSVMQRKRRLVAVRSYSNTDAAGDGGTLVRDFRLTYTQNASSGRSLLQSMTDCGPQGECLPATRFDWTRRSEAGNTTTAPGSGVWGGPPVVYETTANQPGMPSVQIASKTVLGDFNGDGVTDMLYADGASNSWRVCLSTRSSFDCQSWPAVRARSEEAVSGDFDGDGKTDILVLPVEFNTLGTGTMCLSTGTSFSCGPWSMRTAKNGPQRYMVVDMDGDGRDDLLVVDYYNGYLCRSTGTTFVCGLYGNVGAPLLESDDPELRVRVYQRTGDINGDGRPDILKYVTHNTTGTGPSIGWWKSYLSTATGFVEGPSGTSAGNGIALPIPGATLMADYNGDAYGPYADTAILAGTVQGGVVFEVCQSTGIALNCAARPYDSATQMPFEALGDFDLDGRIDGWTRSGICQFGDANITPCSPFTGSPLGFYETVMSGDFNGDGIADFAYYDRSTLRWTVRLMGHGGYQDLLSSVLEGAGRELRFEYAGVEDSNVYTRGQGTRYPYRNLTNGIPVVKRRSVSDGVGGWSTTDYRYEGARIDLLGRGSLGFSKITSTDSATHISTALELRQDFPFTGLVKTAISTHANGVELSRTTHEYIARSSVGGARWVYPSASVTVQRDLNGADLPTRTTRVDGADGIDSYGNVTRRVTSTVDPGGEIFETVTVSQYENRVADWLLGLKVRETISKSSPSIGASTAPAVLALTACAGGVTTIAPTPATLNCRLRNVGQSDAGAIVYTAPSGVAVSGPAACPAGTSDCGPVSIRTETVPANYAGAVRATPTVGTAALLEVSLTVQPGPGVLVLTDCATNSPTTAPTAATFRCAVRNMGQSAFQSIAFASGAGTSVTGPTGACASGGLCGTVTVSTGAAATAVSGTLLATADNGSQSSAGYSLSVLTPGQLVLAGCIANSPTTAPNPASLTCSLSNSGQTPIGPVTFTGPAGTSVGGPAGVCAAGASCGTVTVTTASTAGRYAGTLAATPSGGQGGSSVGVDLSVLTPPRLVFGSCSATTPTTMPTAASMSCTLTNDGQTGTSGISFAGVSGTSVTGPTGACGAGSICGTVTVTTAASPGTYAGTMVATPAGGTSGAVAVNLTVYPPPPTLTTNPAFPQSRTISGLGSYSADVTAIVTNGLAPFTYQWSALRSDNSSTTITNATSPTATLLTRQTVACETSYTVFRLAVTDAVGRAASTDLVLTMRSTSPPKGGMCP